MLLFTQAPIHRLLPCTLAQTATMLTNLKKLLPWLKALLGLALLAFVLLWVDWSVALVYLRSADLGWLLLGLVTALLLLVVKVVRSGLLLHLVGVRLAPITVFEAYMVGQALNILLPFRGGEVVRFSILAAAQPERAPESASSIVAEKALGVLGLALLVSILLMTLPAGLAVEAMVRLLPQVGALLLMILGLLLLGFIAWPYLRPVLQRAVGDSVSHMLARADEVVLRWRKLLLSPGRMLPVFMLTALNWLLMWAMNLVLFKAVGIPLGGAAAALVLALLMVGLLPAVSPGNICPFHFFATLALRPFGVPVEQGMAFAILLHAVVTLPTLLIGGVILLLPGRRLRLNDAAND